MPLLYLVKLLLCVQDFTSHCHHKVTDMTLDGIMLNVVY